MTDLRDALDDQTARLVATARGLADLTAPSLCDGWSRDHVLTHVARNAEALTRAARAAVDGTATPMYPSVASRYADIQSALGRQPRAVADDVESTAATLAAALRRLGPEHADLRLERTPGGPTFAAGQLPFMRLREVVYHHLDLAAGFDVDALDGHLLVAFIEDELGRQASAEAALSVTIRTTEGDQWVSGDGAVAVNGSRAGVLRWLARQDPSGVASATLPELTRGV